SDVCSSDLRGLLLASLCSASTWSAMPSAICLTRGSAAAASGAVGAAGPGADLYRSGLARGGLKAGGKCITASDNARIYLKTRSASSGHIAWRGVYDASCVSHHPGRCRNLAMPAVEYAW